MALIQSPTLPSQTVVVRGSTAYWQTNFYDVNGNLIQPVSAVVSVDFPNTDGSRAQTTVNMIAGSSSTPWTAQLDTRNMGVGPVYWSIHTNTPIPVAVEDGTFDLTANPANLVTF